MLRRDGFNTERNQRNMGYELEVSLIELINREDDIVRQMNTARRAMAVAAKTQCNTSSYKRDLVDLQIELENVRNDIREYLLNTLGVVLNDAKNPVNKQSNDMPKAYVARENMIKSLYNN